MGLARDTATVKTLLEASGLEVHDDEFIRIAQIYPLLRAQADGLYLAEVSEEDPSMTFDPAAYYA
jgi:hypothetical protein